MIHNLPTQLLRRHVTNRPHHYAGIGINTARGNVGLWLTAFRLRQLCQTKVEYLHPAIFGEEDVVWLQIAVNDALLVCGREALGNLQRIVHYPALSQRCAPDALTQCFTVEQLRNDIGCVVVCANIMNCENVWMIQSAYGLPLLLK